MSNTKTLCPAVLQDMLTARMYIAEDALLWVGIEQIDFPMKVVGEGEAENGAVFSFLCFPSEGKMSYMSRLYVEKQETIYVKNAVVCINCEEN